MPIIRTLHILDTVGRGGAEVLTLDLCRNAEKNKFDISLLISDKSLMLRDFQSVGVDLHLYDRKMPIDFGLVLELKRIIKKRNINTIHSHQAVDGVHAFLACLGTKVRNVMTFHGHIPSRKDDIAFKFLIPRMHANIAVSNAFLKRMKEDIKFDTSKNFHVIYNGIDPNKFYMTDKKFRKELKLNENDILLGMVGNFNNDGRDQMTICKTLPIIFENYPNVHFVFVGGKSENSPHFFDSCFNFCQHNQILDRTHFAGSRTDINDILNSLDIFVYSSNHDTFGIAVVEAMMSGLPVVVNNIPAMVEITDYGKYARIFKTKDTKNLFDEISFLIDNIGTRESTAVAGKKWALEKFGIKEHINNLTALYTQILK